ncbi:hypothetical protein [Kineococcus sp. R86509]|uniref:hypothetical protein n=1 Tax=Kineococcus sp. R86509 TaxID=3093851 RepID=UPI0036D21AA6
MSEEFGESTEDEVLSPQEQRVRDRLRGAADLGPMPDDVVARVDAALAAVRTETPVASLAARRRPSRLPRLLAAAAAVVVVGGGGFWLSQDHSLSGASSSTAAGGGSVAMGESVPPSAKVLLSGKDYTDATAVQDLAEDTLDEGAPTGGSAPDATPGLDAADKGRTMLMTPQDTESATSDPAQRPAAEKALACTKSLGVDPDSVLAVEIATWRTTPAALVVHTTTDGAEVVVVALDCVPGDPAYSRVDVPLPNGS